MASGFPGGPDFYGGRSMGGGGSGVPIIGNPAPTTNTATNQDLMGMYRYHQQQQFPGGILPESNQIGNRRADSTTMIGKRPFGQFQSPPCTSTTTTTATSSGYPQRNNHNTLQQQLALRHQHQQNQNQMFLLRQNQAAQLLQQQQGGGGGGMMGGGGGLFPRSVKQRTNPISNNSYQSPLSQILPAVAGRGLSSSNSNLSHTSSSTSTISSSSSSSSARFGVPLYQQSPPPFSSSTTSSSSCSPSLGLGLGLGSKNMGSGMIGYSNSNYICSNRVGSETGPLELDTNNNNNSNTVVMMSLKQLEKELLGDDGDFLTGEEDDVSVITNSDWSEAFQNLLSPTTTITTTPLPPPPQTTKDGTSTSVAVASNNKNSSSSTNNNNNNNNNATISPSPTSSTSSSCSSSATPPPNNPCPTVPAKQLISQAALAISDGKSDEATEALSRLSQVSERMGSPEQKLAFYMLHALRCRASPSENPAPVGELFSAEHLSSFHALCELSPCFKFPLLAANLAMLETIKEEMKVKMETEMTKKKNSITVHIVDFDVGAGVQYVNLLRALPETQAHRLEIKITAVDIATAAPGGGGDGSGMVVVEEEKKHHHHHHHHHQMKVMKVLEGVRDTLVSRTGLDLNLKFNQVSRSVTELSRESLGCEEGEILLVNLAYRMFRVPDESVSMDNPRDDLLRRVKRMEPRLVTLVEQNINANTSPFPTRASECASYYGALLDSLDSGSTIARDSPDRLGLEAALGRKAANAVACEGRNRVERCEVFGKWRARMTMAGFEARPIATVGLADSMRSKMCDSGSGRAGPSNFMVKEEAFGICFGWMGRILTVGSAWR